MSLFKRKEPYLCEILDRYRIDIEKTNQIFKTGRFTEDDILLHGREYCEPVAESDDYLFYNYRIYPDGSGGYILRQEKAAPKKIVYFGSCKSHNCVFKNYLFQVDRHGHSGFGGERFGITARNIINGNKISFNWLSTAYLPSKGYRGHAPYRDSVNSIKIVGDKLIFKVTREKLTSKEIKVNLTYNDSFVDEYNNDDFEKYNRNADYELVVEYISNQFIATAIFPPLPNNNIQNEEETSSNTTAKDHENELEQIENNIANLKQMVQNAVRDIGDVKPEDIEQAYNQGLINKDKFEELCNSYECLQAIISLTPRTIETLEQKRAELLNK